MHAVLSMDSNVTADEDALWLGHDSHWYLISPIAMIMQSHDALLFMSRAREMEGAGGALDIESQSFGGPELEPTMDIEWDGAEEQEIGSGASSHQARHERASLFMQRQVKLRPTCRRHAL